MPLPVAPYLYTTTAQLEYPVGMGVTIPTPAGAYTNSVWVTIHASTPQAWSLTGVSVSANSGGLGFTELDLGIGAVGSEVVVGTIAHMQISDAVLPFALPGAWVPAGSRLAVRLRCQTPFAGFLFTVNVLYLPAPVDGRVATPATPLRLAPSVATGKPAGAILTSPTTPWATGAWVTLSGATATPWVVVAAQIAPIAVIGSVPVSMEIDLGDGETVLTTIRWASQVVNLKPTTIALLWPMRLVPPGTTLTARLRTSGSTVVTVGLKLQYYADLTGLEGLTTLRPTEWFPAATDGLTITPPTGWGDSAWVVAGSDVGPARAVTQIVVDHLPVSGEHEIDLGAGGIGAEAVVGTFRVATDQVLNNGSDHATLPLLVAQPLAANTLLSLRARSASTGSDPTLTAAIGYITAPDFALALPAQQHTYRAAADGASATVTNAGWVNSAWGVLTPTTEQDILLTGVTVTYTGPATMVVVDLGVGAVGSEVVLTTVRMSVSTLTLLWFPLTVPHYVPAGTRLVARFRQASAAVATRVLGVTYLGLGTGGGGIPGTAGCTPGFPAGHVPIFPYQ